MKKRLSILLLSALSLSLIGCGAKVTGIVEESQVLQTPTHQNQGNSYKKIFKDSVFLGDSITEGLVSFGVLNEENVIGLTGQTAEFALEDVDEIISRKPTDIFILLGQCDLLWPVDNPIDHAVKQYATLIDELQKKSPETQIHIQTITPVTEEALKQEPRYEDIALLNTLLEELAKEKAVNFIDLSPIFESNNDLYSADGIHFKEDFYKLWVEYVSSELQISVGDIVNTLNQNIDLSDMRNIDAEMFQQFYEIDMEQIEDFALYMASSNVKADEIALIKVKDTSQIEVIKEKVEKRIKDQENKFRDYLPEEYYLVEENILKVKGDFILLAISPDNEKIDTIFSELFK